MGTTQKSTKPKLPNIVCIGGGTGTFVALKGLKNYPCHLTAIVTMADSGGSNKRIRDEFGLLPTSDIRQCLVALSDENGGAGLLRKLFMYRFEKGQGISGMTFGNLFMAALSDILGSQAEAIKQTGRVLKIHGTVVPVSYTNTNLVATYEDGHEVSGEHFIDEPTGDGTLKITKVFLKPTASANPDAVAAILHADFIVLGPGDLYTSLIPNLLVKGISEAICKSRASKAYILNLMTKFGQTYNLTAADHVNTIFKYLGKPCLDAVVVNNAPIPKETLATYAKYHEDPVVDDLPKSAKYAIIREDVISREQVTKSSSDTLVRSLIRHDSEKLGTVIYKLLNTL